MLYPELLSKLFSLSKGRGISLGLERMQALVQLLNISQVPVVHIAGTNGKGSVSTKIASALMCAGYKTGLYTSPHISSFCERFQIDGKTISKERICTYAERILSCKEFEPTFFEVATLIMFLWAMDEKVDFLVLETGLGGRLDATNICSPVLTCITSIDYDHQTILGTTLEEIAYEKAGIIKPYCPVVIGQSVPRSIVEPIANKCHAPLVVSEEKFHTFEEENQAIARTCLKLLQLIIAIPEAAIEHGLKTVPPCRYQRLNVEGVEVVLDVAHNLHGVRALFQRVKQDFSAKPVVIFGCSQDKDVEAMSQIVERYADSIFVTEAKTPRAATKESLKSYFKNGQFLNTIQEPLHLARKRCVPLLIFGSFYIMADIREALGLKFDRDPKEVGELWTISGAGLSSGST